jgi:hypothetical protein
MARRPAMLREELDLLKDYLQFRGATGRMLASVPLPPRDEGPALIVSLTNWVAQVKAEIVFAKLLQARGLRPVILTLRTARRGERYFRAAGLADFVYLDDFSPTEASARHSASDALPGPLTSMDALLQVTYRGVDVGRHALSTLARELRQGGLDLADPRVAPRVVAAHTHSREVADAAHAAVQRVQPRLALFLERGYTPYGEVFDVLVGGGVDTIQWVHSHRKDAFALKRYRTETRGVHPFSLSERSWERVRAAPWTDAQDEALTRQLRGRYEDGTWFNRKFAQTGKEIVSPDEVRQRLGLDPGKKTAVIYSHVLWDATFFYGENLFEDYEAWLIETLRAACANDRVNWIVKIHPDYVWKLKQARTGAEARDQTAIRSIFGTLPAHVKIVEPDTRLSTLSMFSITDYGLTVRGTVGIELPCFGVPVFTAGTGRYSGLGFTIDSSTRAEYLDRLSRIETFPRLSHEQVVLARKHAHALLELRPCPFQSFEMTVAPLDQLGHPLDHNVEIRLRSADELLTAHDLDVFARWALESRDEDFLVGFHDTPAPAQPAAAVAP